MATTSSVPQTGYGLRKRIREWITYLAMTALAIFFLFPIVFMLVSSIKNNETQVLADMSSLYAFVPRGDLGLQNYRDVFGQLEFARLMFNSTFIMVLTVLAV